jgi:hypothetical protein
LAIENSVRRRELNAGTFQILSIDGNRFTDPFRDFNMSKNCIPTATPWRIGDFPDSCAQRINFAADLHRRYTHNGGRMKEGAAAVSNPTL